MLEMFLRANGFKRSGDTWTRQNLTANGLFDLDVLPADGGNYTVVLRNSTGEVARQTSTTHGELDTVTTFLFA
ncbi:DUF4304 domain-containing protein [Amycolatopsis lexingtonensis]|uniref:DUF4304 domain-containing protein n=1 Tax=Amycolatopsis lexingtonensis TaxID=218822 RepID=UPI003F7196A2